jgi:hypothetical protein
LLVVNVAPGIPPIIVHWLTPEKAFYQEWDFWLSVITALLAVATFWLALETRGLRIDSAKAIRASEEGIAVTRDATARTLRSYITVDEIKPSEKTSQGVPREVDIAVVNTGQTPARTVEVLSCLWLDREIPKSFAEYEARFRTWMPTDLGKDQRRTVHSHFIGTDEMLATATRTPNKLVVCGFARYRDMLSDDERRTEFCFAWDMRQQRFYPVGPMNNVT